LAVGHYNLGAGGFAVGWIFTALGTAVTAAYMFFVGEAMFRPAVQDAGRSVPPVGACARRGDVSARRCCWHLR